MDYNNIGLFKNFNYVKKCKIPNIFNKSKSLTRNLYKFYGFKLPYFWDIIL